MEQLFQLKYHGNFSLLELNNLTAEERNWWVKRLNKQKEAEQKESQGSTGGGPNIPRPSMPNIPKPSVPSIRS